MPASTSLLRVAIPLAQERANSSMNYEEGTWTAAFASATGTCGLAVAGRTGSYSKIGRLVQIQGAFVVGTVSTGSGPSGALTITGLPYALHTGDDDYEWRSAGSVSPWGQSGDMAGAHIFSGSGQAFLYVQNNGVNAEANHMADGTELRISMTYVTN